MRQVIPGGCGGCGGGLGMSVSGFFELVSFWFESQSIFPFAPGCLVFITCCSSLVHPRTLALG